MERLTTDAPLGLMEKCLNLFYAKDGEAWVRGMGSGPLNRDVTLYDFTRNAIRSCLDEECGYIADFTDMELSELMVDWLYDGNSSCEGVIATLYTAAWAFAELRARLKQYEDMEQEGRLVALPYPPRPMLKDRNPVNTDVYCPECGTNLSGYYGDEPLPIVICFHCGEILDPCRATTRVCGGREDGTTEKRLIDANMFAESLERMAKTAYPNLLPGLLEAAEYARDYLPTADAVEVVRCEKCLYRSQYADENGNYKCGGILTEDDEAVLMVKPEFFCSYGERKDND